MAGQGKSPRAYERFWKNAIAWLVRDPGGALLLLETDRRTVGPGESLELRAHLRQESYAPEVGAPVTLRIHDASGGLVKEAALHAGDDGVARLLFEPGAPGFYAVTATSGRGEAGPLYVERVDESQELADAAIHDDVLRALAQATGGRVMRLEDDDPDLDLGLERDVRVEAATVFPLWRTWPTWGVVAGLACVEWWLRRRWGLA